MNFIYLIFFSLLVSPTFSKESSFLKEIVQGRCYEEAPTGKVEDCPGSVESIMSVLENHKDADIQESHFQKYLTGAKFSTPNNKALFYLQFLGSSREPAFTPPAGYMTPEDTAGGSLMKGLVFCGVDQNKNCSKENSKAYWTFWEAVYAKVASQVTGHLQIVVEPLADTQFLLRSVIPKLSSAVSSVTVYGKNKGRDNLAAALETTAGVGKVTCKDDVIEFYLDSMKNQDDQNDQNDTEDSRSVPSGEKSDFSSKPVPPGISPPSNTRRENHSFRTFGILIVLGVCLVGLYNYWEHPVIAKPVTTAKSSCLAAYSVLHEYWKKYTNREDVRGAWEGSPLINRYRELESSSGSKGNISQGGSKSSSNASPPLQEVILV